MTENIIRVAVFISSKYGVASGVYFSSTVKSHTAGALGEA